MAYPFVASGQKLIHTQFQTRPVKMPDKELNWDNLPVGSGDLNFPDVIDDPER